MAPVAPSLLSKAICFILGHKWDPNPTGNICLCMRCGHWKSLCWWHLHEMGDVEWGKQFCSKCSCLLDQKKCDGCGLWFLNWEAPGSGDGVIGRPCVDDSGDLVCADCCTHEEDDDTPEPDPEQDADY
jgi:hypothetical protein